MPSDLFNQLYAAATARDAEHAAECRALWNALQLTDIVACSQLVDGIAGLREEFDEKLTKIARENRMRVRRTCPDCGSPYCVGATLPPDSGIVVVHGNNEAEIAKKLLIKFGY